MGLPNGFLRRIGEYDIKSFLDSVELLTAVFSCKLICSLFLESEILIRFRVANRADTSIHIIIK